MKKYILFLCCLLLFGTAKAQLFIGTDITVGSGEMLFVGEDLSISPSGNFANAGNLYIKGNWANGGIFTPNTGTAIFIGTNQIIAGANGTDFHHFLLNQAIPSTLTFNSPISTTGNLTLTSGRIVLGAVDLLIKNGSATAISGGSTANYIITSPTSGSLAWTNLAGGINSFLFPIGTLAEGYLPFTMTYSSNPPVGIHKAKVLAISSFTPFAAAANTKVAWEINKPSGTSANLSFDWQTNTNVTGTLSSMGNNTPLIKSDSPLFDSWADIGITYTGGTSISGYNFSGGNSRFAVITAASIAAPTIPTNADNMQTASSFTAVWSPVAGALSYQLDVAIDPSFTTIFKNYNGIIGTSQLVSGLQVGVTYYYRVRAFNGGTSANSAFKSITLNKDIATNLIPVPLVGKIDDIITIRGNNFSTTKDENIVKFGDRIAIVESATETELKVRVPANVSGRVNITVSINGRASAAVPFDITPEITSISPATANFNETISIIGTGFSPVAANNIVTFGAITVKVISASATSILVQVPDNLPLSKLSVSVKVGEQTGTLADAFSITPPVVQNFSPTEAYAGENITILGSGFPKSGAKITIGGVEATIVGEVSSGSIIVKVPLTLSGKSEIIVQFGTLAPITPAATLLVKNLVIENISPLQGFTDEVISLTGDGFSLSRESNKVFFGDIPAEVLSAARNIVTVKVPAKAKGDVDIIVKAGIEVKYKDKFSANVISVTSTKPSSAKVGETIDIIGLGFEPSTTTVLIGGKNAAIIGSITSGKITVRVPDIAFGKTSIEVNSRGDRRTIDFTINLNINDVSPTTVFAGEMITITGTGFSTKTEDYIITIGEKEVKVVNPSSTQFSILVPKGIGGKVPITINGININYDVTVKTKIDRIEPLNAKIGDIVTIWGSGFRLTANDNTISFANIDTKPLQEKGVSEDWLKVKVPEGSGMSGEVFVNVVVLGASKITSINKFGIIPTLGSFIPEKVSPNQNVNINGTGFSEATKENKVIIGNTEATVLNATATSLTIRVPNLSGIQPVQIKISKQESNILSLEINAELNIITPKTGDYLQYGSPLTISFSSNLNDPMKIELLSGGIPLELSKGGFSAIVKAGDTFYQGFIASSIPKGSNYQIRLTSERDKSIVTTSGEFNIGIENLINKLTLLNPTANIENESSKPLIITVEVGAGLRDTEILCFYKPFSSNGKYRAIPVKTTNDPAVFFAEIPFSLFDKLGIEYYFQSKRNNIEQANSVLGRTVIRYPSLEIPYNSYGKNVENYEMISIPLKLQDPQVTDIFKDELGAYNIKQWRTFSYRNGSTNEFAGGTVNVGEAFWLIIKDNPNMPLMTGAGTTIETSTELSKMHSIKVRKGWNQVGNPYLFALDFENLKKANKNLGIGGLFTFEKGTYIESKLLNPFRGGFVFIESVNGDDNLKFPPAPFDPNSGGKTEENEFTNTLSSDNWQVKFNLLSANTNLNGRVLSQKDITNYQVRQTNLGGFGMHPKASKSKDDFDVLTPPRFLEHLEVNFMHNEYFYPYFSKDIVPTQDNYVWEFSVESGTDGNYKTLSWEKITENQDKGLILFDIERNIKIDMSKETAYTFELGTGTRKFKLYFGGEHFLKEMVLPENASVVAYPNPFTDNLKFSISLPEKSKAYLQLYNSLGQVAMSEEREFGSAGFYVWQFSPFAVANGTISPFGGGKGEVNMAAGVYLYQLQVETGGKVQRFSGKVVRE